jgi:LysM repeat protein
MQNLETLIDAVSKVVDKKAQNIVNTANKHTVKQGDNLSKIAKQYNTTVEILETLNPAVKSGLSIGQQLIISNGKIAKTYNGTKTNYSDENLDYIFASLKKFAAVHKMPYAWVLKVGSIWHRYKKYVNTNVDILDNSWKKFDAIKNYDPVNNSATTVYNFTIPGQTSATTMVLETTNIIPTFPMGSTSLQTIINTGFYPKLINDFNVFYQGYNVYTGYTSSDIQKGFTEGVKLTYVPEAVINDVIGTTTGNSKTTSVIPWSVSIVSDYGQYMYVLPSHGGLINQTKDECFDTTGKMVYEVTGNTSMYNGSVRLFWSSPNYGYFDTEKVVKPEPIYYLKQIFSGQSEQENFSINGVFSDYSKMSEIFSILDRDALDKLDKALENATQVSLHNSTQVC